MCARATRCLHFTFNTLTSAHLRTIQRYHSELSKSIYSALSENVCAFECDLVLKQQKSNHCATEQRIWRNKWVDDQCTIEYKRLNYGAYTNSVRISSDLHEIQIWLVHQIDTCSTRSRSNDTSYMEKCFFFANKCGKEALSIPSNHFECDAKCQQKDTEVKQ